MSHRPLTRTLTLIAGAAGLGLLALRPVALAGHQPEAAAPPASRAVFPVHGFSIDVLEPAALDGPPARPYTVLVMSLPVDDSGFAPNVNVQAQPWTGDLEGYLELSRTQIEERGWTLRDESVADGEAVYDFEGAFGGFDLRWHARVLLQDGTAWLVTASARPKQWEREGDRLRRVVSSFRPSDAGG